MKANWREETSQSESDSSPEFRLEKAVAPEADPASYRMAMIIYERRRKRYLAAGMPFVGAPPNAQATASRDITPCVLSENSYRY